jgi:hypothetical protein
MGQSLKVTPEHSHTMAFSFTDIMGFKRLFFCFLKGSSLHRTIEKLKKVNRFF